MDRTHAGCLLEALGTAQWLDVGSEMYKIYLVIICFLNVDHTLGFLVSWYQKLQVDTCSLHPNGCCAQTDDIYLYIIQTSDLQQE